MQGCDVKMRKSIKCGAHISQPNLIEEMETGMQKQVELQRSVDMR